VRVRERKELGGSLLGSSPIAGLIRAWRRATEQPAHAVSHAATNDGDCMGDREESQHERQETPPLHLSWNQLEDKYREDEQTCEVDREHLAVVFDQSRDRKHGRANQTSCAQDPRSHTGTVGSGQQLLGTFAPTRSWSSE
jgi:hypothetical protein